VEGHRLSVYFQYLAFGVMEKSCDACGVGDFYFRSGLTSIQSGRISGASNAVHQKSTGNTLVSYSGRRRLSVYFLYLAWRLWKSVVTLAVSGNTISGRDFIVQSGSITEA
jgi:hypothetical protein